MGSAPSSMHRDKSTPEWPPAGAPPSAALATFAGGCFWSVQLALDRVPGVVASAVGYAQGAVDNPTYEQVCSGRTGHTEAVQVLYDPAAVGFPALVAAFMAKIDPTQRGGQGNDVGSQYRTGIYWHDAAQRAAAEAAVAAVPGCAVEVAPAARFWPAEAYHQKYLERGAAGRGAQSAAKGCTDPIRCYG